MTTADFPLYRYRATAARVIDGDSLEVAVDCGFRISHTIQVRIAGINAPEIRGPSQDAGDAAKYALQYLLADRTLYVATHRDGRSFARYIADCWVEDEDGTLIDVATEMVARGHAVRVTA